MPKTKIRAYRVRTYDVWGNARNGFEVNDVYSHGTVSIRCKREVFNPGTPNEFETFEPTDRQLSFAAGFGVPVSWNWNDSGYTADHSRNGKPIGELILESEGAP